MKIFKTMLLSYLLIFPISYAKAEIIPDYIVEKCQKAVIKDNPVKITYNYGTLSLDLSKNTAEISKVCKTDAAAGCFQGKYRQEMDMTPKNIKINEYICEYPVVSLHFNFTGSKIYITNEYKGCVARAVLRHELQHFMIWKTANDNMLSELKNKLPTIIAQNASIYRNNNNFQYHQNTDKIMKIIYQIAGQIADKWDRIRNTNDAELDKVDHDFTTEVNYRVCELSHLTHHSH